MQLWTHLGFGQGLQMPWFSQQQAKTVLMNTEKGKLQEKTLKMKIQPS